MKKIFSSYVTSNYARFFSDLVLLVASSYLFLKKTLDISVSTWLLKNAFQQPLVDAYIVVSGGTLILAIIVKAFTLFFDRFPVNGYSDVEPGAISDCLVRVNNEILEHLLSCSRNSPESMRSINDQHGFSTNLAFVASALAEHIRKTAATESVKLKAKSLFISLYSNEPESNRLKYELHYDPKRDNVESRIVKLDEEQYKDYEMVKCLTSNRDTAYVYNAKKEYAKGASKRYKTIKHYLGCKLTRGELIFGFLNIEFHHNSVFADEEEMRDYMEEHVYPFKLLLEYQYLKKAFFEKLRD